MPFRPGDRVELVATNDPYTSLRPGDRGTVTGTRDVPEPSIDVRWDTGSSLSVLPAAGDRIRKLADHPGAATDPPAATPAGSGQPSPPVRQPGIAADPAADPAVQPGADPTVARRPYTP